ncbi:MAG: cadherin-like beta sandwich domain-containing protein [Verrucomicrobiales bacterium]|nr:cadherin-like beta sandwich domain-containing protein [Verrucomicrobiales bacterium]
MDLQNDDATPGADQIVIGAGTDLITSGSGAITMKASTTVNMTAGSGTLRTENGDITLEGNQQATPQPGAFYGVVLGGLGSRLVEATGSGNIVMKGRGGVSGTFGVGIAIEPATVRTNTGNITMVGTGAQSAANLGSGIQLGFGTVESTGGGSIDLTGTGAGTGLRAKGINFAGFVRTTGAGAITLTGTGSSTGSGSENYGVDLHDDTAVTIDGSGLLTVNATGGANASPAFHTATGTNLMGYDGVNPYSGNIIVNADSMSIANAVIRTTGTATLRQKTNGTLINLGAADSAGLLGLTDAELDQVTAGTLVIGDANSGAITIRAVISPANYKILDIQKGVAFSATGGFDSDVTSAAVYERIKANGAVSINTSATLTATALGGFVPAALDAFTILDNVSASTTTGNFSGKPEGTLVAIGGVNERISYAAGTGNDVVLQSAAPTVTAMTGTLASTSPILTITGTNFDTTPGNNTVTFNNGAVGTVTAATATSLTVTLTTLPTSDGSLTVIVSNGNGSSGSAVQVATFLTVITEVRMVGNDLHLSDVSAAGTADFWTISTSGGNLLFSAVNPIHLVDAAGALSGAAGEGTTTVTIPLSVFTGNLVVLSAGGTDVLNIDNGTTLTGDQGLIVDAAVEATNLRGNVTTAGAGDQTYNGPVNVAGNYSVSGNDVTFNSRVNSKSLGGAAPLTTGLILSFDAGLDTNANSVWENTQTLQTHNINLGANLTRNASPVTAIPGISAAYVFPTAGTTDVANYARSAASIQDIAGDPSTKSATFELWFKPDSLTGGDQVLFETGGNSNGFSFYIRNGNTLRVSVISNASAGFSIEAPLTGLESEFIQAVATLDINNPGTTDTLHLYLNGVEVAASPVTHTGVNKWSGPDFFGIGGSQGTFAQVGGSGANGVDLNPNTFAGEVSIARLYNSVLTSQQIASNFSSVQGNYDLTINATGDATFNGPVGNENFFNSIDVDAANHIVANYPVPALPTGAVLHYTMDETPATNGVTLTDSSGSGNSSTLFRAAGNGAGAGKFASALSFPGGTTTEYAIVNPVSGAWPTTAFTVSAWVKPSNAGYFFSYAVPGTDNEILFSSNDIWVNGNALTITPSISPILSDGQFHHVAMTWNSVGGALLVYVDGVQKFSGTITPGSPITGGGSLVLGQDQDTVGGNFDAGQSFGGSLDEVAVFNRALSPAEVANLATAASITAGAGGVDLAAVDVTVNAPIISDGGVTVTNTGTASTISGVISGAGGLTKQGAGTLDLIAANTFAGDTTIDAGIVRLRSLIQNGSFESPALTAGDSVYYNFMTGAQQTAFGWTSTGNAPYAAALQANSAAWAFQSAPNGGQAVSIQGNSTLSQSVNFPAPGNYTLAWKAAARAGQLQPCDVKLDGITVYSWQTTNNAWIEFSTVISVPTAGAHVVTFVGLDPNQNKSVGIDAVTLGTSGSLPSTTAVTLTASGAVLDLNGISQTLGSIAGVSGTSITLGRGHLTTGDDGTSTEFAGVISGAGNFVKAGGGTLNLSGANSFTGTTTINAGTLRVNGSLADGLAATDVIVNSTGTLDGSGTINGITQVSSGGSVAPGAGLGILNTTNVVFSSGATFSVQIGGATVGTGYDQLNANGNVNLGGATLNVASFGGFVPSAGESYLIINRTGGTGTFAGLAEGAVISADFLGSGLKGRITYVGGDGNDVEITTVSDNADLSNLVVTTAALTPIFDTATFSYTSIVLNDIAAVTVTPTTADAFATVKVNGSTVVSGNASASIPLIVGDNTLTTIVTAEDGTTTKTYTVVITRYPPSLPLDIDIVTSGSPAPEMAGQSFSGFFDYTVNGNGNVLSHILTGGPAGSLADAGVFSDASGTMDLLAREGDAMAPGVLSGTFLDFRLSDTGAGFFLSQATGVGVTTANDYLGLVDDGLAVTGYTREGGQFATLYRGLAVQSGGDVACFPATQKIGGGVTAANDTGIFLVDGATGSTSTLAQEGTIITGTMKLGTVSSRVVVSESGTVVYQAALTGVPLTANVGVFKQSVSSGSSPVVVALKAGNAPGVAGAVFNAFAGESVDPNGNALIEATMKTNSGLGITAANDEGLWAERGGSLELVIREGDAVADAQLGRVDRHEYLADGTVVVRGLLKGASVNSSNDGVILTVSALGVVNVVLREGDTVADVGNSKVATLTRFDVSPDGQWACFFTLVSGTGDATSLNSIALVKGVLGTPAFDLTLRKGDQYFMNAGIKTVYGFMMTDGVANTAGGSGGQGSVVNDAGQMAAGVYFSDSTQGIFVGP